MLTSLMYLAVETQHHRGHVQVISLIFLGLAVWRVVRWHRRRWNPWL